MKFKNDTSEKRILVALKPATAIFLTHGGDFYYVISGVMPDKPCEYYPDSVSSRLLPIQAHSSNFRL